VLYLCPIKALLNNHETRLSLVAGMVGPKMKDVLAAKQVRFVSRKGNVQGVVNELKKSQ
jgi:hypothetical protein